MDDGKKRSRPSPRLAWQVIDGEAVILDVASAGTVGLNRELQSGTGPP